MIGRIISGSWSKIRLLLFCLWCKSKTSVFSFELALDFILTSCVRKNLRPISYEVVWCDILGALVNEIVALVGRVTLYVPGPGLSFLSGCYTVNLLCLPMIIPLFSFLSGILYCPDPGKCCVLFMNSYLAAKLMEGLPLGVFIR